jgi:hypothetical protein
MRRWFLSYNSLDSTLAERLEAGLRQKDPGAELFIASKKLRAGQSWSPALADAIAEATAFILLIGEKGIGPWQVTEYLEAHIKHVSSPDFPIILLLLEGHSAPGLPFLRQFHWIVTPDPASEAALAQLMNSVTGASARPVELWRHTAPYRGLGAMTEADSDYFFGRARETIEALNAIRAAPDRLPVLLGDSGVGKSSLAQAGVVACLRRQAWPEAAMAGAWPEIFRNSRTWCFLTLRPGTEPLDALVGPFLRTWRLDATDPGWERRRTEWTDALLGGQATLRGLLDATERRLEELDQPRPSAFFLYVDQGEELYTRAQEQTRRRFCELLADGLGDPRLFGLMSLRADYLGALQNTDALYEVHRQINVPRLGKAALRDVVHRPAEVLSARFETDMLADDIVQHTIAESARDAGTLPLLSYLLDDMWTQMVKRADGVLRLPSHSLQLGEVLAKRGDAFLQSHRQAEDRLRRIFTLKLATVHQHGPPTRRRAFKSEFSDADWHLVSELADDPHRLLVTVTPDAADNVDSYVEVAHEKLFHHWAELQRWIESEREFMVWMAQMRERYLSWMEAPLSAKAASLLQGNDLRQARKRLKRRRQDIDKEIVAFIRSSHSSSKIWRSWIFMISYSVFLLVIFLFSALTYIAIDGALVKAGLMSETSGEEALRGALITFSLVLFTISSLVIYRYVKRNIARYTTARPILVSIKGLLFTIVLVGCLSFSALIHVFVVNENRKSPGSNSFFTALQRALNVKIEFPGKQ